MATSPRTIYHTLHPHPALHPVPSEATPSSTGEQRENESAWRQLLIQGVLAVLLPTEDLENGCLRALVAEIFAEMILGNGISGKACEGWLLWEGITRIAEVLQHPSPEEEKPRSQDHSSEQPLSRLERYGLLAKPVGEDDDPSQITTVEKTGHRRFRMAASGIFWTIVQYIFVAATALRAMIKIVATSSSLPRRVPIVISTQSALEAESRSSPLEIQNQTEERLLTSPKRPLISMKMWSCASQIVEIETRMPWLSGFMSMLQWGALYGPGRVGNIDGVLDR